MVLYIELDGNNISVTIKKGGKTIDSSSWFGEHSLSEQLLVKIDELLEKNGIDKKEIKKVVPKISKTSGVTSSRIVQTLAKAWNVVAAS
ncbi:MAG TPA: hypothetical protein PLF30_00545 [Candidatus Moranbacteria bacterium]|jgi:tRNA A37 threonylcarbamoyladenosine modification protein TsaB|nr:hypothetical protein [Candidatus Moranbacteria bacterium]HPX94042.1 hypothetical protein [Candidatus Moranbacteria bacterium]HQB59764.1 hypothetical protein [Candidatus Moranbacteria bacterium]